MDDHAPDPLEILDWKDSLNDVLRLSGPAQAERILKELDLLAAEAGVAQDGKIRTPYVNTIPPAQESPFPGSREMERRIKSIVRWNAMAMVLKANKNLDGIGGHISTFASSATLYEIGFNHFWRAPTDQHPGDLVYFQGHASPGMYARAFVEGRLSEQHLLNFRRELAPGGGLSSYPHPWLMPDFWQFPTVSMGIGPLYAIYQARFQKYLMNRGLKAPHDQKVWAFLGDGECDEPESLGCLSIAGRESLDNLVFVINCNLQRLDGPVRGNARIVDELEGTFRAAGWNVIKCLWGSAWDPLLAADEDGLLQKRFADCVDGEFQKLSISPGSYVREHFFGRSPELLKLVAHLSDDQLKQLKRGGHDPVKVYNAYKRAAETVGRPTCILAKTVKGYGMGEDGEGRNIAHQQKKMQDNTLFDFRTRFALPLSDEQVQNLEFYRPPESSPEMQYLRERRAALGGPVPQRKQWNVPFEMPAGDPFTETAKAAVGREISTTMYFVNLLAALLRDKAMGKLIVPIIPDEARTFGMDPLFARIGIYSPKGQLYEPVDRQSLAYYKESKDGQVLQEGINEAGALASFTAAGLAYTTAAVNTIPFYVYYSMFGFQRVGDLIWASADSRVRGFLLGATAGRTTLNGEGLQHEDGHSHLIAASVPNLKAYDPAYAYELAVIIQDGIRRMYVEQESVFYYLTLMNENYAMPAMPEGKGVREGILKGAYKFRGPLGKGKAQVNLLGSGVMLNHAVTAQEVLQEKYGIRANVYSVTSTKELREEALGCERWNLLHPEAKTPRVPYLTSLFDGEPDLFVATSDYMRMLTDALSPWIPGKLHSLGCEGFGRSESRAALRDFFEVDHRYVTLAALRLLAGRKAVEPKVVAQAIQDLGIDPEKPNPLVS
jgi:pyruvate dehydrogenase E1 component